MDRHLLLFLILTTFKTIISEDCPKECICLNNNKFVSCKDKQLSEIPTNIPTKVEILDLTGNNFTNLPSKSFINLINLQKLILERCKIKIVSNDAFEGLISLENLTLLRNDLLEIDKFTFKNLMKLEVINLKDNNFVTIPNIYCVSLIILNLDGNKIWNAEVPELFKYNKKFRILILSNNFIENLSKNDFVNLRQVGLQSLILSNNRIIFIDKSLFEPLAESIVTLKIDGNSDLKSQDLEDSLKVFAKSKHILNLDISNIGLKNLTNNFFRSMASSSLQLLNLSNNLNMNFLDDEVFLGLRHIKFLFIVNCNLLSVNLNFKYLTSLKDLHLGHNILSTFPNLMSSSVELIELSYNRIQTINRMDLRGLNSLRSLNLAHNFIEVVDKGSFYQLSSLGYLDLSYNKLKTFQYPSTSSDSSNLKYLDLSHNIIVGWPSQTFQSLVPSLIDLNLSFNRLKSLSISDTDDNYLSVKFPLLKKAWFSYNPWNCTCRSASWLIMEKSVLQDTDDIICEFPKDKRGDSMFQLKELRNCSTDFLSIIINKHSILEWFFVILCIVVTIALIGVGIYHRRRLVNKWKFLTHRCRLKRYKRLINDVDNDWLANIKAADHDCVEDIVLLTPRNDIDPGQLTMRIIDNLSSTLNQISAYHSKNFVIDYHESVDENNLIAMVTARYEDQEKVTYLFYGDVQLPEEDTGLRKLFAEDKIRKYRDIVDELYILY